MTTKTKLIIQAGILVGAPMALSVINITNILNFDYSDSMLIIFSYSPLAMVFFGILFAMYFIRLKTGKLTIIRLFIKWGIYLSIAYFVLMILVFLNIVLPDLIDEVRLYGWQFGDDYSSWGILKHMLIEICQPLIFIALMYLSLRINKSIESNLGSIPRP